VSPRAKGEREHGFREREEGREKEEGKEKYHYKQKQFGLSTKWV
jgi:hypothetical protein